MKLKILTTSLVLFAFACAKKPLMISSEDQTFHRAQQRLQETTKRINEIQASDEEHTLFLQAEGLYEYRFSFPPRGFFGYLAEGAAAATDFPAFQALAGSLDLADLRIRSSDSAVHLWETLLTQYPNTPLRPLTLYRLGWAYRNTAVTGLPRKSGNEAFDLLVKEYPDLPLTTLSKEALGVPWKSKSTATAWSFIPGAGQIYVGETLNGVVRLTIGLAALSAVVIPIVIAYQRGHELEWGNSWPLIATGFAGLIVLSINYTAAYQDAMRAVVEFNEREEDKFLKRHPDAP